MQLIILGIFFFRVFQDFLCSFDVYIIGCVGDAVTRDSDDRTLHGIKITSYLSAKPERRKISSKK